MVDDVEESASILQARCACKGARSGTVSSYPPPSRRQEMVKNASGQFLQERANMTKTEAGTLSAFDSPSPYHHQGQQLLVSCCPWQSLKAWTIKIHNTEIAVVIRSQACNASSEILNFGHMAGDGDKTHLDRGLREGQYD